MKLPFKKAAAAFCVAILAGSMMSGGIQAQEATNRFPTKPITIWLAASGAGSLDTEFRLYLDALKSITNSAFLIDFKGGAGGSVGAAFVARQSADGHTLLGTVSSFTTIPLLRKDAGYDVEKDFEPVTLLSKRFFMLLVHPGAPYKTLKEYLAYVRDNPGKLNWSTTGVGSSIMMPGLLLHSQTGTKVTFIPYKKASERFVDLMAGRVQVTVATTLGAMSYVKSGKLRPIAVTGGNRTKLLPSLPTISESGIAELSDYEYATWLGMLAPAKTPISVVNRINSWFQSASKDASLMQRIAATDTTQVNSSPEQFRQFLRLETIKLKKAIMEAGIVADEADIAAD